MADNNNLFQSLMSALSAPQEQPKVQNRDQRRKETRGKKGASTSPTVHKPVQESSSSTTNITENPMFTNVFASLMQQMNSVSSDYIEVDELKEKIVQKVLDKLGLDPNRLQSLCESGKGSDVLASIDRLEDTKAHDFLIAHSYPEGNHGYIAYKGSYEGAKRHALVCLGKEHGMFDGIPDEDKYCVRRYPVYTLQTNRVVIEVIPHASWVSIEGYNVISDN